MRIILLLLSIILVLSCKTETKEVNLPEISNSLAVIVPDSIKTAENAQVKILTDFDIDYIKSKTASLTKYFNIDSIETENLHKIQRKFLEKYISCHKIEIGYPEYLPADYPTSYSFYQFKELENFYLFTFIHENEFCCKTLYAVTTEKKSISIISIAAIGFEGGDGGWMGERYGHWLSEYGIDSTMINIYERESAENNHPIERDTTWSEYQFDKKGMIKYMAHHQVKYLGDKQIQ